MASKVSQVLQDFDEVCVESDNSILPLDKVVAVMKMDNRKGGDSNNLEKALAEKPGIYCLDTTGYYSKYPKSIIGYKFKDRWKKGNSIWAAEAYRYEDPSNTPYINEYQSALPDRLRQVIQEVMDKTFNDRMDKFAFIAAMNAYTKLHPQDINLIRSICYNDRKLVLALNQFFRTSLHITKCDGDSRDFYISDYVVNNLSSISEIVNPVESPLSSSIGAVLLAQPPKLSRRERKKLRRAQANRKAGDTISFVVEPAKEEPKVKPAPLPDPPEIKEVVGTPLEPDSVITAEESKRDAIDTLLKQTYSSKGRYYSLKYMVEYLRWVKPYLYDTGNKLIGASAKDIMLSVAIFAKEHNRRSMLAHTKGTIAGFIRELETMYTIANDLPVEVLYFDTIDNALNLVGFKFNDDLMAKIHPELFKPKDVPVKVAPKGKVAAHVVKAEPKVETKPEVTVQGVLIKFDEPSKNAITIPSGSIDNLKEVNGLDINGMKRAIAIESDKMSTGMIDGESFLSDNDKKALVAMLDKHGIRDMIIYTKLSEDRTAGQVAIRLVKDEYFGDFDLVTPNVSAPMRRINIASFTTKRPSLTLNVPLNQDPASIVFKEDLEPWGYDKGPRVVESVVAIVNHFMAKK